MCKEQLADSDHFRNSRNYKFTAVPEYLTDSRDKENRGTDSGCRVVLLSTFDVNVPRWCHSPELPHTNDKIINYVLLHARIKQIIVEIFWHSGFQ